MSAGAETSLLLEIWRFPEMCPKITGGLACKVQITSPEHLLAVHDTELELSTTSLSLAYEIHTINAKSLAKLKGKWEKSGKHS